MGMIGSPTGSGKVNNAECQVIVKAYNGSTITAEKNGIIRSFRVKNGVSMIRGLENGRWLFKATLSSYSKQEYVDISGDNQRTIIWLYINMVPDYEAKNIVVTALDDFDNELSSFAGTMGDWKLKFKEVLNTSYGSITFTDLHGQTFDIFLVGGGGNGTYANQGWGGCGGGGGYTTTAYNVTLKENVEYRVVIGGSCGTSKFYCSDGSLNLIANGGQSGFEVNDILHGGSGGSGGGGGHGRNQEGGPSGKSGNGGSDGKNGTAGVGGYFYSAENNADYIIRSVGGAGQGRSTREFGEQNGTIYSSGGAGGSESSSYCGVPGAGIIGANSGAGGSANRGSIAREIGYSGVVIIRNSRTS